MAGAKCPAVAYRVTKPGVPGRGRESRRRCGHKGPHRTLRRRQSGCGCYPHVERTLRPLILRCDGVVSTDRASRKSKTPSHVAELPGGWGLPPRSDSGTISAAPAAPPATPPPGVAAATLVSSRLPCHLFEERTRETLVSMSATRSMLW